MLRFAFILTNNNIPLLRPEMISSQLRTQKSPHPSLMGAVCCTTVPYGQECQLLSVDAQVVQKYISTHSHPHP